MSAWARLVLLVAGLCAGLAATASAAEPDRVRLRAWPHPDFVRLVFDWPGPVDYRIAQDELSLSVRFSRPLDTSFEQVRANVADYVPAAGLDSDGQSVNFRLAAPYRLRHFVLNGSVVIDLMDDAPPTSAAAGDAPRVRVRVGSHARFTRFVFDWPTTVDYAIERSDGGVVAPPKRWRFGLAVLICCVKRHPVIRDAAEPALP